MSSIGPSLPPHLLKRKRSSKAASDSDSDSDTGPAPPASHPTESHPAKPHPSRSPSPPPKRRILGPSLPPAPVSELPPASPSPSSSDDDDIGPAAPTTADIYPPSAFDLPSAHAAPPSSTAPQRDTWMTAPPTRDDLTTRTDPTRPRPRRFAASSSAHAGIDASWTETAAEKRARLADEVMGRSRGGDGGGARERARRAEGARIGERVREGREKEGREGKDGKEGSGKETSLYERHRKTLGKEEEDDPSARAFDYEKDMGAGMKIGRKERKELVGRAAELGSRFAGGGYL